MANSNDVLPLYIGDDRTDEDAFKAMLIFHLPVSLDIFVAHDYCVINVAERTFSVSC
jgi:trehalose-6-phosphatase